MTFPILQSITATNDANTTGPRATMPATVNVGDLLLCFAVSSTQEVAAVQPAGWTNVRADEFGSVWSSRIFAKVADGTEGGTTATGSGGSADFWSSILLRITGWSGTITDVQAAVTQFSTATTVEPIIVSPSWGSADNLFLEALFTRGTLSAFSTNYSNVGTSANGHGGTVYGSTRTLTAASDDPDAVSLTSSVQNFVTTLAVKPAVLATSGDRPHIIIAARPAPQRAATR